MIPLSDDIRRRALTRMRLVAGGLLAAMAVLLAGAIFARGRWPDLAPALGYVQAFAEAALVGACADWFAVSALFRHPLGLPIPHTAIVPRNRDRIGRSLGAFVGDTVLTPDVVSERLRAMAVAHHLGRWLARERNAALAADRLAAMVPAVLETARGRIGAAAGALAVRALAQVAAAPLAARVLAFAARGDRGRALFDGGLAVLRSLLDRNEDTVRAGVSERSWRWLPRWVDEKVADRAIDGLRDLLRDLDSPDHPWRASFRERVDALIGRLAADPELLARGEAIKAEMLADPQLRAWFDSLGAGLERVLADAVESGALRQNLAGALAALGRRIEADEALQAAIDSRLRDVAERYILPRRGEIGAFITKVVERWDTPTLVARLELQVGRDLQFIRINGTLVGGLVGLALHLLERLLT